MGFYFCTSLRTPGKYRLLPPSLPPPVGGAPWTTPRRLLLRQPPDSRCFYEIKWALCGGQLLACDAQIAHCRYYRGMTHQRLDGPEVHSALKQMCGKTMTARGNAALFCYSRPFLCIVV